MCCVVGGVFMIFGVGVWRYFKREWLKISEVNPSEWRLELDKQTDASRHK